MEPQPRSWPVLSGTIPSLAAGYTRRPETGHASWDALRPGVTVILCPDGERRAVARQVGGNGKTQLAAAFARRLWAAAALDLLVWLDAPSRDRIVAGYAQALADIRVAAPVGKPEAAAARFLTWLSETGRPWLVVLDGVTDWADTEGLWPHGPTGQTLVTTRLASPNSRPTKHGSAVTNAASSSPQQLSVALSSFSQREALQYLSDRLNDDPYQSGGAIDLAAALDCLPAGLDLAVAYLLDSGEDCRQYRLAYDRYRQDWFGGNAADPLAPAWMLAVDRVSQFARTELPWPALKLAAVSGPACIPGAILTSAAACTYMTGRHLVTQDDQASVRAAYGDLERVGLVTVDPDDEIRTVQMAPALQSSVRRVMGPAELRRAVQAAADAAREAWPDGGSTADMELALRDCATSLRRSDEMALWTPGCHPLLVRVGQSLDDAGMVETALGYWRDLVARAAEQHGPRSTFTCQLRDRFASAAAAAGHPDQAVVLREELAADIEEMTGLTSPQAIGARLNLARAFRTAGRLDEAISLGTRVAAECSDVLGQAHPQTRMSLRELATAYGDAGRYREAIDVLRPCLALHAETIGIMHPETVSTRDQLAEAYRGAGRGDEAIKLYQQVVAQVGSAVGATHPDSAAAKEGLALAYYRANRTDDAAATLERVLADWRRAPGGGPASTIGARTSLAAIYCLNGRARDAIPLYEAVRGDLARLRPPGHPDTFRVRCDLAAAYHHARRLADAVELGEATLADGERILGAGHAQTLRARANLAHAYHATGRLKRASAQFDRALRDCEEALGPDDPLTTAVQALRKRYLAGRQGSAPIVSPPGALPGGAAPAAHTANSVGSPFDALATARAR